MKRTSLKQFVILLLLLLITASIPVSASSATIKLSKTKLSINVGKTSVLKVKGTSRKVKWSSSKKTVVVVSSAGKITAKKKGTAIIKAKVNGKTLTCKVTVKQPVTSIKINKKSVSLSKKGATVTLKATVSPSAANKKAVLWTSSNKKVATVSSAGKVKAVANGTAIITAKAKDGSGKKATCKITVKIKKKSDCDHEWMQYNPYEEEWSACPSDLEEEKIVTNNWMGMHDATTGEYRVILLCEMDFYYNVNFEYLYLQFQSNGIPYASRYLPSPYALPAYPAGNYGGPVSHPYYIRHTKTDTPYKCNCGEKFADYKSYIRHVADGAGENMKILDDSSDMVVMHYAVPNDNVKFYCDCGKTFDTVLELELHALDNENDLNLENEARPIGTVVTHCEGVGEEVPFDYAPWYRGVVPGHYIYRIVRIKYACIKCGIDKK